MAVIKKFAEVLNQDLSSFATFIVDTNPNSQYFKITEFKDTFTGGKNGFLIEGSEHLKESTEIKIQILDVDGNPIYYEPGNGVPEYYEGTSKVVAVYVYEDTPIGSAKITILSELKTYVDEAGVVLPIPAEWEGVYNAKWERTFQVNRLLSNEDKVRFYRRPKVNISEIVKPIFNNVTTTIVQTGSLSGTAQFPQVGTSLTNFTPPTTYLLSIEDNTNWTGSVVGTTIQVPSLGYTTTVDSVINNKDILVLNPYTQNGLVSNFVNAGYTASFNYVEGANNLKTALTGSFAKININDLETFIGDCARVKIFRKSQSDVSDYQFIQEIRLESNEILRDLESQIKNEEFYGIFDSTNIKNYWITSSNSLTSTFNQNYLFNSAKLDSTGVNYFYTSKSLDITENTEYTLNLNARISSVVPNNTLKVFLSGSRQTTVSNVPKTIQIQQDILSLKSENTLLQKTSLTQNFRAEQIDNPKLYFEVNGNNWYIADVSLRASQETSFSPNEITFIQGVPRTLPEETFLYRFEFYDINNNFIPVLVEATKTFDGGNLQRIQKGLVFNPRSLQFQFDSGSNPVPPTVVGFTVTKNLLTGSVTYTSQSFDFDGNELFGDQYTASITLGGGYPGLLDDIPSDAPTMTVQHFTGSRTDKTVQLIKITGECEGFTDTVIFSRVLDGFGGVNYVIRPYRGTQIRNSSTSSLEVQAVRIDGVNDIELSSLTKPEKGWPDVQLHILSRSLEGNEKFVNLAFASSSKYVLGLITGSLGSREINYNAVFDRDSIDVRRTIYMMSSASAASGPAFQTSGSVLASIILEDLQDGLDTPVVIFNADTFNIDPRNERTFRPQFAFATASFYKRGSTDLITASFQVFPSMSINSDWVPEYWFYYTTQSVDQTISVVAIDENRRVIPAGTLNSVVRSPLSQSKNITIKFTYTEPYTSPSLETASISVDKTFTIVPQGTPGDESIVFEVVPSSVTLMANARGVVKDYKPSITEIKLKQGSRYLAFTGSVSRDRFSSHGTFHIAQASITASNITGGLVYFDNNYTSSLIISQSSGFDNLSGSITYPLIIHPYYTSSIYTASVVQQYSKVLDSPDQIEIIINPATTTLNSDEVGYIAPEGYVGANTTIRVKEGGDFLRYTTQSFAPGTWRFGSIETRNTTSGIWNIRTGSLSSSSLDTATLNFNRFDYPHVSASVIYNIIVYPYSLGPGHEYTSSVFQRTQTITKNVPPPAARSVDFKASSYTINYDRDGVVTQPEGDVTLTATAFNTTGSVWFRWYFIDTDGSEVPYGGPDPETTIDSKEASIQIGGGDAAGPGEIKTWKVKIWDGDPDGFTIIPNGNKPIRAEGQLTISGVKGGADAYKYSATNLNTSITADLWTTQFSGSAIQISAFKGTTQLNHTSSYVGSQQVFDYLGNFIGNLGFYSSSIFRKSNYITLAPQNRMLGNPASIPNITAWTAPAVNTSGEIIYKIDYENGRQIDFVTQSISVQFTPPAPYDVKLQNDNSSIVYRVSGEIELNGTSNIIRAYRGDVELTNVTSFTNGQPDAYGITGYPNQCRVQISSLPGYIHLDNDNIQVNDYLTGTPASMPGITAWDSPETNPTAEIVYKIYCEGRAELIKTQSLSVQYEGNTGPGIVMRGLWNEVTDYIGSVETVNQRRDAIIFPDPSGSGGDTHYWAAISGSGPATFDNNSVLVGKQIPTDPLSPSYTDTNYWQYLGQQDFFVAAKIAIFEESFVKNTINVGNNPGSAFANVVIAGGRTDPYIAIGQVGTSGASGVQSGTGVIGYDRPGIFLGIYENAVTNGTNGRFSISNADGSKALKWNGTDLTIIGGIRQVSPGVPEGSFRGAWTSGTQYYIDDVVTYGTVPGVSSYIAKTNHISTNDTNINTGFPPNATNAWTLYAAAGTSGTAGTGGSSGTAGTAGATGPGVVYRGEYNAGTAYIFQTGVRRDIVRYLGSFYITKQNTTGNLPTNTTFWEPFGAQFSSVATDILLAQDATITRGLVMGSDGSTSGFIRSANVNTLTTGSAPGFYLQTDGQFRLGYSPDDVHFPVGSKPPYLLWDNATLTIRGKIETDQNTVSRIGNWKVQNGAFMDEDERIVLDGATRQITIKDSSGTARVFIKQANISSPTGASLNAVVNPAPTYDFSVGETFGVGSIDFTQTTLDSVGFSVSQAGTYTISSVNWGLGQGIYGQASFNFDGYVYLGISSFVYDTADKSGNVVGSIFVGGFDNQLDMAGEEVNSNFSNGYTLTITFPAAGTYYVHTDTYLYGYVSAGSVTISGQDDPAANTLTLQQAQTELGQDGFLVVADANNYVKIQRTLSDPIVDIKTNGSTPGLRITNTNASPTSRAIEVLAGDVRVSGTGNNITVSGGYIGTENTSGGIRFQTDGANSVLIGQNWPSQASNVATARLRIGTKLGISGRELIFDSSTIRVKTNIEDYPNNAYDSVKRLRPVLYTPLKVIDSTRYITDGEDDYTESYPMSNAKEYIGKQGGFIAEWLDADPEMRRYVSYGVSGSLITKDAINYDMIVVPLTKAVQILMDKVEALEAHISSSL